MEKVAKHVDKDLESTKKLVDLYINDAKGLLFFIEDFFKIFCTSKIPDFHKELYNLLRDKTRLALAAPRSFAKSTIVCVFFPIYCALFDLKHDIVIISASETLSIEWLRKIKLEFQTNQALIALYAAIFGKAPQSGKWAENHIILSNGVNIRAKGAEAQIRGYRPDLFICDDIETDEGVRSEDRRKHLKEWFKKAVIGTLDPKGQLVIIGTILHYLSLLNHLIEDSEEFGWETRLYQAYKEGVQEEGHELWADKWSHEALQLRKAEIGSFAFCTPGETPILMGDFSFKKISEIKIGDDVIGWKSKKNGRRTLCPTKVKKIWIQSGLVQSFKMASGRKVRCTKEHRWFTGRGKTDKSHKEYAPAKIGSKLQFIIDPFKDYSLSKEHEALASWFGGMFDGEGSCSLNHSTIFISQSETHNPIVCKAIRERAEKLGFYINKCSSNNSFYIIGGMEEKLRFLKQCKPVRGYKILNNLFHQGGCFCKEKDRVLDIIPEGFEQVFSLETETGNYVAWGYASSNSSEYMNNPVPEDAAAFKTEYINYYEELPPNSCVMVFDPAYTEGATSDYKVCSIIAKDSLSNRYLVDYIRTHNPMADYLSQSINLYKRYKPLRVGIPTGTERSFYNTVIERFNTSNCYPEFCEIRNVATTASGQSVRKKEARIVASLQGLFQAGKYYLKKGQKEAIDELLTFPAGKHDDLIDTLASAEQILDMIYVSEYEDSEFENTMYEDDELITTHRFTKYR